MTKANTTTIRSVATKADRKAFVELPFRLYAQDSAWVPPLKDEAKGLITAGKNPFFEHAKAQLFLAERGGEGRRADIGLGRLRLDFDAGRQGRRRRQR
jgi:hypothetical protein